MHLSGISNSPVRNIVNGNNEEMILFDHFIVVLLLIENA